MSDRIFSLIMDLISYGMDVLMLFLFIYMLWVSFTRGRLLERVMTWKSSEYLLEDFLSLLATGLLTCIYFTWAFLSRGGVDYPQIGFVLAGTFGWHLWKAFGVNPWIGGVIGFSGGYWLLTLFSLINRM